jgi:glycosyltransferase involved in cell wall biosynthesis
LKKLLVIADSPTANTGFGTVIRNVFENVPDGAWDIHMLAINYYGDAHPLQSRYKLYNPSSAGDVYGFAKLPQVLAQVQPDLIFILNDVWLCSEYVMQIRKINATVPIVIYTPIDAENVKPEFVMPLMTGNVTLITYTEFAKVELQKAGYVKDIKVIPHGVDIVNYYPMDKLAARKVIYGSSPVLASIDLFVVLYVGRNQIRKRVDTFIYIFAKWLEKYPHDNCFMHYHGATKDLGIDVEQWAHYLGVDTKLILTAKNLDPGTGIPLDKMKYIYNAADVYLQTCAVEGFGMPLHEAMRCKVAAIVPDYSALSDWPSFQKTVDSVAYVPVHPDPWLNQNGINTIHKMINAEAAIEMLETLYQNKERRNELAENGYNVASDARYMWTNIGMKFHEIFTQACKPQFVAPQQIKSITPVWRKK